MLSETSQTKKDKYYLFSLICGIKQNQAIDRENRLVVDRGGR